MRYLALAAMVLTLAACGPRDQGGEMTDTGAGALGAGEAGGIGTDTATAGGAVGGPAGATDTAAAGGDTAPSQTQSGVTDAETGESTLDTNVKKTRPDQGEPVTSKGDTATEARPPR